MTKQRDSRNLERRNSPSQGGLPEDLSLTGSGLSVSSQGGTNMLGDLCPNCHASVIEEKHDFNGESLAVLICTKCETFDWELPKKFLKDNRNTKLFKKSEAWAEEQVEQMRMKHNVLLVPPYYSENVKHLKNPEMDSLLNQIARCWGFKTVYVGKFSIGVRIEMK
jgi:uncharacterized Zn finger protein (UPF0148 family)